MIKVNEGNIEIRGDQATVLAELSTLVHHLFHGVFQEKVGMEKEEARKAIMQAVEDGFKAQDELIDRAIEILEKLSELLKKNNAEGDN